MRTIHKSICLLLACWLPLFFSASVFASSAMMVDQTLATVVALPASVKCHDAAQKKLPCAEHEATAQTIDSHCNKSADDGYRKCAHCGLCANFALYLPVVIIPLLTQTHSPASHVGWTSSPTLTPSALRPPIVL